MSNSSKLVPLWIRVVVGLLGLLTLGFTLVSGGFTPPGLSLDMSTPLNAFYLFNSRSVAIGICMLMAAMMGTPESIAIVMIFRFMLEIADRLALSPLYPTMTVGNLLPPLLPAMLELAVIITVVKFAWKKGNRVQETDPEKIA